ncbi:hypothetical protein vseg_007263 [Gypsophila vaccaria]
MSTICSSPQIFHHQDFYNLISNESDQIILDFRAPPPSPTGSSRRTSSVTNEGVLSEYLENSLRVPDLILPNKIFPRQKPFKEIPALDFTKLNKPEFGFRVRECFEEFGCFQVVNHGVSPELVRTVGRRAGRVFRVSKEEKAMGARSAEVPFGFEEMSEKQDESVVGEVGEEFVWGRSFDLKVKMEGILPLKYSKFR